MIRPSKLQKKTATEESVSKKQLVNYQSRKEVKYQAKISKPIHIKQYGQFKFLLSPLFTQTNFARRLPV